MSDYVYQCTEIQVMLIELFGVHLAETKSIVRTTKRSKNFMQFSFWKNDIPESRFIILQNLIDAKLYQHFFDKVTEWNDEEKKIRKNKNRRIRRNKNVMD